MQKKKKDPTGLQTILDPALYSQKICKSKNNFRCFPFLPVYSQITKDQMPYALESLSIGP